MAREIDYRCVEVPNDKDPENFTYAERRAAILRRIEEEGQPWTLNKSALGRKYGVSHTTISNDVEVLADHIGESLGEQHELVTNSVMRRCIQGLLDDERWAEAARITLKYEDWLMDVGAVEREPERKQVAATVREQDLRTDSYEIVTDDGTIGVEDF